MSLQWKVLFVSSQKDLKYTSKGFTLTKKKDSNNKGIFLVLPHMYFLVIYLVTRMRSLEGQICVLLEFRLFSLSTWNQEILVRCGLIICLDQNGDEIIVVAGGVGRVLDSLTPRNPNSVWTAGVNVSELGVWTRNLWEPPDRILFEFCCRCPRRAAIPFGLPGGWKSCQRRDWLVWPQAAPEIVFWW